MTVTLCGHIDLTRGRSSRRAREIRRRSLAVVEEAEQDRRGSQQAARTRRKQTAPLGAADGEDKLRASSDAHRY